MRRYFAREVRLAACCPGREGVVTVMFVLFYCATLCCCLVCFRVFLAFYFIFYLIVV